MDRRSIEWQPAPAASWLACRWTWDIYTIQQYRYDSGAPRPDLFDVFKRDGGAAIYRASALSEAKLWVEIDSFLVDAAVPEFGDLAGEPEHDLPLDERLRVMAIQRDAFGRAASDLTALARRLSDALIKVRPLGGSELFTQADGDFYADPDYCGRLIDEGRERELGALAEVATLRKRVAALEGDVPPAKSDHFAVAVDRMPLADVAAEALEHVAEGDRYGSRAHHPTTIRTRQLLERLAREALSA